MIKTMPHKPKKLIRKRLIKLRRKDRPRTTEQPRTTTPLSNKRSSASIATDFASTSLKHDSSASASVSKGFT
ncbi:hypothetical protein RDI58_029194 [Solanum bulbocastanum]|uniref:Uncharacterized protein n=1 Tax=Solanum bulbocastanum TaxID=147425 RepID=A0AAN8ST65_SOLBU